MSANIIFDLYCSDDVSLLLYAGETKGLDESTTTSNDMSQVCIKLSEVNVT